MKPLLRYLLYSAFLILGPTSTNSARAAQDTNSTVHVISFIEVAPSATVRAQTSLTAYRKVTRTEPGATMADVYMQTGVPSHFVTYEIWENETAYVAHTKSASMRELSVRLKPIEFGPPDVHTHKVFFAAQESRAPSSDSVLIVSHLDVGPAKVDMLLQLLKPFSEASAADPGMIKYQILQQAPLSTNHFRLVELWASEKDWTFHNLAPHTQTFRNELAPLLGTPYDQRRYEIMH